MGGLVFIQIALLSKRLPTDNSDKASPFWIELGNNNLDWYLSANFALERAFGCVQRNMLIVVAFPFKSLDEYETNSSKKSTR